MLQIVYKNNNYINKQMVLGFMMLYMVHKLYELIKIYVNIYGLFIYIIVKVYHYEVVMVLINHYNYNLY